MPHTAPSSTVNYRKKKKGFVCQILRVIIKKRSRIFNGLTSLKGIASILIIAER